MSDSPRWISPLQYDIACWHSGLMPPTTVVYRRALDPSEKLFADVRCTVAYSVIGSGQIDIDSLATALTALQQTYPVLSGQIRAVGDGDYDLLVGPPAPARIRICSAPVDELPVGDDAVVTEDEVCAVEVAQRGNDFRLTLFTHHSVADGLASIRYLEVLCELYTQVVQFGSTGDLTEHPLPRSVEQLLAANGIEKQPLPNELDLPDPQTLPPPPPREAVTPDLRRGRVRLTRDQTTALGTLAKQHGLTVHGIVAAAVLLAAHDLTGARGAATFTYMSAVNLRTRLNPPVPPEAGTSVLGVDLAPVSVDPHGDVFGLGRAVLDSIATNLANQSIHQWLLHQWDMREKLYELVRRGYPVIDANAVIVTNFGALPEFAFPDCVTVHDFRGSFGAATVDERLAANVNVDEMNIIVTTFKGRLSLDYQTWVADDPDRIVAQATALRRAFERLLGLADTQPA